MRLTRATNYAVRALVFLARLGPGCRADMKTVARRTGIPAAFLGKVMQCLARAELVRGSRGGKGGYALARPAGEISVRDVVEATEGGVRLARCVPGAGFRCPREGSCGAKRFWARFEGMLNRALESETIAALAAGEPEGERDEECGTTRRR